MPDPDTPRAEVIDAARGRARDALSDKLADLWSTFLIRGLLAAAVGIAALFWPSGSIAVLLQIIGALLILDGVLTLFTMMRGGPAGSVGIGAMLIGLVLLIWPEGTARLTFILLGAWALVGAAGSLMTWWQMPETDPERSTARNAGLFALFVGLVLVFWPGTGVVALGWAIAFAAFAIAAVMLWLASRFKRAKDRLQPRDVTP